MVNQSIAWALRLLLGWSLAAPALAQTPPEGFRNFESKAKGLALFAPIDFDELPVPPTEDLIQMKFAERKTEANKDRFRSEIWVIAIPKGDVKTGATSAPAAPNGEGDEQGSEEAPKKDPKNGPKPIRSYADFVSMRLSGPQKAWKEPKAEGKAETMFGKKVLERFSIASSQGKGRVLAWTLDDGDQTLVVHCLALDEAMKDWEKKFERTARSLRVTEATDALGRDIELHYKLHPFRNVEYRKEVRRNLPKGWKAEDTENFILIYSTKDQILLSKLKNDLEVCRTKYIEIFPPTKTIEAVSTVRVCKDKEEFMKFAGTPEAVAGFWNVKTQELVFYDGTKDPQQSQKGRADSIIVLYHEAFHQYIYYACGEVAPHSWFNEGFGDYFSGCQIGGGGKRVDRIGVNPWRCGMIKRTVDKADHVPLKEIVRYSQGQYYANPFVCYAEGWSLIYFLRESKVVARNPKWKEIIPTYFKTLVATYQEEVAKAGEKANEGYKAAAQEKSRQAAVEAAFKDWTDAEWEKLESEWKAFVKTLVDPNEKK